VNDNINIGDNVTFHFSGDLWIEGIVIRKPNQLIEHWTIRKIMSNVNYGGYIMYIYPANSNLILIVKNEKKAVESDR